MNNDLANFKAWYANILAKLYGDRNAGLAVFILSLPLAERYLRQRAGIGPGEDLNDMFMNTLRGIFPALSDLPTARKFWQVYRNGYLHQATLSCVSRGGDALPEGSLTHDIEVPVSVGIDGSFCVNPVRFSQCIVSLIESDFRRFVAADTSAPALPSTVVSVRPSLGSEVPPATISTKGGP